LLPRLSFSQKIFADRGRSLMNPYSVQMPPPMVLSFAASDPSGGAGLQADLMTASALGCHALSVTTALTVQDSVGVASILAIDADWVEDQARTLLEDMPVAAFKIGLLGSAENMLIIAEILADYPLLPVVLDPVLASGRGDELADEEMIATLREVLLPLTTILTPNSLEARRLAEEEHDADDARMRPGPSMTVRSACFPSVVSTCC
jgi:hydroxymethylpyrimidine/phosphomethylpyrimidine kinase